METISIQVDTEVAKAFQSADSEQRQKIQALMGAWLKQAIASAKLQGTMDQLSEEATTNGLTPEILHSILND